MLLAVIAVIMFIIIAMMWPEGLWSNAITFINTLFAGLMAWNTFEYGANWIEDFEGSFTYVADYLAFWAIFAFTFNVLRGITDKTSDTKVRFRKPVDIGGGAFFAVMTALLFTSIVVTTLHFAPLGKVPFGGSFAEKPEDGTFLGMKIEDIWLYNMDRLSKKVEDPKNPGEQKAKGPLASGSTNHFDPKNVFKYVYQARRAELEEMNKLTGSVRTGVKPKPKQ